MIKYLIEKEFKQMLRNSFLPKLIFIFPCMIMILMPWAANLEIKNINLNIVDNDHSVVSRRLVDKIRASTYFRLTALPATTMRLCSVLKRAQQMSFWRYPMILKKDWINGKSSSFARRSQCGERNKRESGRFLSVFHHQRLFS